MTLYLLAAASALLVSLALVPPTIALAQRFGLLDAPDAARRLHCRAVPRLGGIAVWCGAVVGLVAAAVAAPLLGVVGIPDLTDAETRRAGGLLAGIAIMVGAGLFDDVRGLRPAHKFAAQLLAAIVVVSAGFRVDSVALPGAASISLGWIAVPATVLWIVGVTNAFNLIDGLDGLAGGVALVGLASFGIAGVLLGNNFVLALVVPLAGAVVGFLRYNIARPSRIFLGDVGSLSIGFALAVLSIEGARRSSGDIVAVVPLFALAFPLLDTTIAMTRRWLRGVPLSAADGRHVHHQLVGLGLTRPRASAAICLFAACVAGIGLSLAFAPSSLTVTLALLGGAAGVLIVVHGLRWLGYHEFIEAHASFASGVYKARSVIRDRILARELEVRIRNATSFTELELLLTDVEKTFGFERVAILDEVGLRKEAVAPRSTPRILRLDRPLAIDDGDSSDGFVLRVAWRDDTRRAPLYAERVVRMLAPALEDVLRTISRNLDVRITTAMVGSELGHIVGGAALPSGRRRLRGAAATR